MQIAGGAHMHVRILLCRALQPVAASPLALPTCKASKNHASLRSLSLPVCLLTVAGWLFETVQAHAGVR